MDNEAKNVFFLKFNLLIMTTNFLVIFHALINETNVVDLLFYSTPNLKSSLSK